MTTPQPVLGSARAAGIVLGAGNSTRAAASQNKVFLPLAGRRVLSWSLLSFARVRAIERFILVIREADRELAEETIDREIGDDFTVEIVIGGETRHESELLALRHLAPAIADGSINIVLLHDGARPILSPALVRALIRKASLTGAVFPGLEADDIRQLNPDGTLQMLRRERFVRAQTPQVFEATALLTAYEQAASDEFVGTDTVSCWEQYSPKAAAWLEGDIRNIKITYPQDLFEAERILRATNFHLE